MTLWGFIWLSLWIHQLKRRFFQMNPHVFFRSGNWLPCDWKTSIRLVDRSSWPSWRLLVSWLQGEAIDRSDSMVTAFVCSIGFSSALWLKLMICVVILELGGYLQYDGYDYSPNSRRFKWEGDATMLRHERISTGIKLLERCWHPRRLTWNLKMMVWKMTFLFQGYILRFHVNLPGCILGYYRFYYYL